MDVAAALARELARHGTDTIFGVTGDANLFLVDSFVRHEHGRYVAAAGEAGAVLAAKGYAAVSGRLGVATVTHGPGLTNTVTALVDGARDGTPLLLVAGDTAVADIDNLQNIDQRQVVLAAGAGFVQVRAPSTVSADVAAACRRALAECRPVVLNVPADFMSEPCQCDERMMATAAAPAAGPEDAALDRAVGIIASARRPIVLAGRGAIASAARAALLALAERTGAPVATTLKAKDLFRGEECDLGIFGTLSHAVAAEAIDESDCVIAFGASLNRWTTAGGAYLEGKRVVQCDVDWRRLGERARIDCGIAGDSAVVARAIIGWLDEAGLPPTGFRSGRLRNRLTQFARTPAPASPLPSARPALGAVLDALDKAVPGDRVLVLDAGRFTFEAFTRLRVEHPRWFVPTTGFGSIGLGMGHAVGAACSRAGRPVLLVAGDGGFMLGGLTEFNTAVRYGLDVIVAICNDGSYGAEYVQLRAKGVDPSVATFRWPALADVATSLGGTGVTVASTVELRHLPAAIAGRTGPLLIDAWLDPDEIGGSGH